VTEDRPLADVLRDLSRDPTWQNVTARRTSTPRPAVPAPVPAALHPQLQEALKKRGITTLYSHQERVWNLQREGKDVVMATPTASGKSLAYHLPVLDALLGDARATALYLFPTKALARDQLDDLRTLWPGKKDVIGVYDGDTPPPVRRKIKSAGRLVITNPDMLHTALLPHHPAWARFFGGLRYVVVDEIHQYRGVFGSHAANVFRRLERLCRFHGSNPRFIASSATIANPGELGAALTSRTPVTVSESGAPAGRREFIFYNPPLLSADSGMRAGNWWETVRLTVPFLAAGHRAIIFARSRKETEILLTYLRDALKKAGHPESWVRSYRGGHLAAERRQVEEELRNGDVRAVVSTTALELGIDVGDLDLCVMSGYPGSVSSTWQQAGRAGRRVDDSAAIVVAENSPLDQFIVTHPDYFFGQPPESAAVNPDNPHILLSHLACACFELPVREDDIFGGEGAKGCLEELRAEEKLHRSGDEYHWVGQTYPAAEISLRSAGAQPFRVVDADTGATVGEVDAPSAPLLIHTDAIYLHRGRSWHVESLDLEERTARARAIDADYFTEPQVSVEVEPGRTERSEIFDGITLGHGEVEIITQVTGFRRLKLFTHESLGEEELGFPPDRMSTTTCFVTVGAGAGAGSLALQGLGYLLSRVAPLHVLCDAGDIRSHCRSGGEGGESLLHLYDSYPGGAGFSGRIFESFPRLAAAAVEIARRCPCLRGCPSCFGPGTAADPRAKGAATDLLTHIAAMLDRGIEKPHHTLE
jgi:DEAD/DEAH box helicase domain-containing protein